ALTEGERYDQWRQISRGEVRVVIGARSAVFAPLRDLGFIVVDEEHDSSFKQDVGVRYNARDLALVRGQREGCTVVLGSATPSLESYQRAMDGKGSYIELKKRPTGQALPSVEIIDMSDVDKGVDGQRPLLSPSLRVALESVVSEGEQAILFLNRRGHSTSVICGQCGEPVNCPHCDVSLTYHRRHARLRCHYCDYSQDMPSTCPSCESTELMLRGAGTEKLVDKLSEELSDFRFLRLDRDTASGRGVQEIIEGFRSHRADVLVGTQMVTKGHDFPRVTLVGVVLADTALRLPDFRSGERTFQILAQVAGRAGRGDSPGRVIVQTYLPRHQSIIAAAQHDFARFATFELEARKEQGFPPFGYLIALRFEGPDIALVREVASRYERAAQIATTEFAGTEDRTLIVGPTEAPLAKLKDQHRWQMLLRSKSRQALRALTARVLSLAGYSRQEKGAVTVIVDVDPGNLL
ncbi:MAG: primosomal protein N', partial [Myxococcales bacterium]|nr:primosomal protein N' [Myxococcales bacterium]